MRTERAAQWPRWAVLATLLSTAACTTSTRVEVRDVPTSAPAAGAPATSDPDDTAPTTSDAAPGSTTTTRVPDCVGLTPITAADRSFQQGDLVRTYQLVLPRAYDNSWAAPLVIDLHGYGINAKQHDAVTSFSKIAKKRGFVVVTPDATGDPSSWNVRADPARPDDFSFIHGLVAELATILCLEPEHVFVVGHANGGKFAAALVCTDPHEFAGLAMVSASSEPDCAAGVQPSVLEIAGTADATNPYEGDDKEPGAVAAIAAWAVQDGCSDQSSTTELATGVQAVEYAGCASGRVTLVTVEGGANPWPGGTIAATFAGNSEAGRTFDASDTVMDFFKGLADAT